MGSYWKRTRGLLRAYCRVKEGESRRKLLEIRGICKLVCWMTMPSGAAFGNRTRYLVSTKKSPIEKLPMLTKFEHKTV